MSRKTKPVQVEVKKMAKPKRRRKPTGLVISRTGKTLTLSWTASPELDTPNRRCS